MKLSLEIMKRIFNKATAKEIDFLLYVMRFQDNMGVIKGITSAEVCQTIGVHKSKFYDIIVKLEAKGLIRVFWNEKRHGFWTISVIDNFFVEKESYKKGYINLNTKFLWSDKFLNLTKAEKVICLKILALYRENRKKIPLRLQTLMDWTGTTMQSVKKYIFSIKAIFKDILLTGGIVTINLSSCFDEFSRNLKSERETHNKHLLKYILAVKKVSPCDKEINDTLTIFKTLEDKHGVNAIITAIIKCLDTYKTLIPKYINKLAQIISKDKSLIELFY